MGTKKLWLETRDGECHIGRLIHKSGAILELQARQIVSDCIEQMMETNPQLKMDSAVGPWTWLPTNNIDIKRIQEINVKYGWKLKYIPSKVETTDKIRELDLHKEIWKHALESSIWGECKYREGIEAFVIPISKEKSINFPMMSPSNPPGIPEDWHEQAPWLTTAAAYSFEKYLCIDGLVSDRIVLIKTSQFEKPIDPKLDNQELIQSASYQILDAIRDTQIVTIIVENHSDFIENEEMVAEARKIPFVDLSLPIVILNCPIWKVILDQEQRISGYEPVNSFIYQLTIGGKHREIAFSNHYLTPNLPIDHVSIIVCNLDGLRNVVKGWIEITLDLESRLL